MLMNGMEMRWPCFGCDVLFASGSMTRLRKEGETCDVMLADGTPATLCSEGPKQGFYIRSPLRLPEGVERNYPYATHGNTFLRLAHGIARAT